MQTQKTTSFSKILANKNSNNNPAQQVLTTQQEAISPSTNPFFIDQTKANFLLNNYQKNLGDINPRFNENESRIDEQEEEEEEDFDDQGLDEELDNSNLEFSDHAGVYEVLNEYQDFDFQIKNFGKYDIGKLKRNYKLTFGKKMLRENDDDSLVFSSLNPVQKFSVDDYANTGHESYEDDLYDDDYNEDQRNESIGPSTSYLEQISKDILMLNNTGDENQIMDENILNWSMKLSSHDQFRMRSRSRSPNSGKQWKSFANCQNRLLSTQFQNFNQLKNFQQLKLEQKQFQSQQYNKKSSSTTSWGKLKNSKSNSSNIGLSNQSIANSNEESHFSNFNNENSTYGSKSINSSHYTNTLPSNTQLYKVYQTSKGNLNSSNLDDTATSTSGSDLSFQLSSNRQSRTVPQETQSAKKISFCQLKHRSLSSCAIAANSQLDDNKAMKKSIGIQHEPEAVETFKNDTSPTILCMVVDKSGRINKKDLLMAAAKAKSMADQAGVLKIQRPKIQSSSKRSSSLFTTKNSLPDLTFLTHYSDKKSEPSFSTPITKPSPPNPQSAPSDLLKRKTLKSIKRYRQTKQNTEPCAAQVPEPPAAFNFEENIEFKFERRNSLPFNKRGQNPLNSKQPLKSCLKRRESRLKHSQSLQNRLKTDCGQKPFTQSTLMFVPFVGYLFSCDMDSSTRYTYYNSVEKNRLSKMYKQLTGEFYEEEEEINEEDEPKNRQMEITKSDNDLRIKKMVKFKPIRPKEPANNFQPAPLLQYDTLIAMLKSSKEKKPRSTAGVSVKNSNIIEADSISMASLSESPPSEFKFSDDEENLMFKKNHQIKHDKIEHVKNLKKNFHTILLKDQKLNNLKEILLELKAHQEKQSKFDPTNCSSTTSSASFSANSSSTSTCSSITSPLNTSVETKESIERLAGYLFDFLKQNLKPSTTECLLPTSNIFKSTIDSPFLNLKKPNQLAESNTLTQTFSQYTQLWNLIECTMNANLELQRQTNKTESPTPNRCLFFLPKEVYLVMFQEINKFASSTNQTYLIDNSINTSQLRRKHHFMVMLMSLKFKFQLFIIYLLNHKQLANWFEHVNRDKNLLKNFYDFKQTPNRKGLGNNSSGDSGMGTEFMQMSTSSSNSSSISISTNNFQLPNPCVNEANFNFNQLELKLQTHGNETNATKIQPVQLQTPLNQEKEKVSLSPAPQPPKPPLIQTPIIQRPKHNDSRQFNNRNHIPKPINHNLHSNIPKSSTNVYHPGNSHNHSGAHHSHSGFNLKNISKRFNIKSWFTSSTSNTNIPTSASHNNFTSHHVNSTGSRLSFGIKTLTPSNRNENKNSRENVKKKMNNATKCCDVNTTGVLGSGVGALCNNSNSFMKHSLSEPSLNAILDR